MKYGVHGKIKVSSTKTNNYKQRKSNKKMKQDRQMLNLSMTNS